MSETYPPEGFKSCGYCRKRGSACVKHGGTSSQIYVSKKDIAAEAGRKNRENQPAPEQFPSGFVDRFNCSMCAQKGALCDMHERYVNDQNARLNTAPSTNTNTVEPLKPAPAAALPAGVKASEQQNGGYRIVQIKVGEVIITIKEPHNAVV